MAAEVASMASTTEALLVMAVALLVIYMSRVLFKQQRSNLPPGPTPLPIIGSLHLLGTHPHQSLAHLARKYGPVMSVQIGQHYHVVATSPEAVKEFLKHQDANFFARPPIKAAQVTFPADIAFADITPELHRQLRKIFVTELTSSKRLEASKHIRSEEVSYMLRDIAKETGPIKVNTYLHTMSTNILSRMILGKRVMGWEGDASDTLLDKDSRIIQEFLRIMEEMTLCFEAVHLGDFFNLPKWFDPQGLDKRFRKLRARMDVFFEVIINQHKEERRKNPIEDDEKTLLDVLLEEIDNPRFEVTEELIQGVFWNAFAGGTHTIKVTSEWAIAEVLRNPAVLKKTKAELDRVVGLDCLVEEADIAELKYTQAIVKETMRLHATVPMLLPHQSINATTAFGYDIPAKTRLFVNLWGMGRDPEIWETPLEFVPERFMDGGRHATTDFQGLHYELLPFGTGRRMCPGMALASKTVHLEVASLLHAFDWSLPVGMAPEKLDMAEGPWGISLQMRDPLLAVAEPRLPAHLYQTVK